MTNIKALSFCLIAALIGTGSALAEDVRFEKGEGGNGNDAYLPLSLSGDLSLAMIGCRKAGRSASLQLGLYVSAKDATPSELKQIAKQSDNKLRFDVCSNRTCENKTWELLESGSGDTYFTKITVPFQNLRAIRIIFPGESQRYEYTTNLPDILKRICR